MIPRVVHQVWVGPEPPPMVDRCVESWRRFHPGWGHVLWRDGDLRWLDNVDLLDRAGEIVPAHSVGQLRADVARYEILAKFGGVYVDCDFEALAPIDDLVGEDVKAFAVRQPDSKHPANGLVGVRPGDAVMRECVAELPARAAKLRGKGANRVSGPALFGPKARQSPDYTIYPAEWFFAYSWRDVQEGRVDGPDDFATSGLYAVHHWLHRRQMYGRSTE